MSAFDGISLNAKISLGVAGFIMMTFFTVQTCIVFGVCEPSLELAKFGWGCVVFFMPPFFKVVVEFLQNKKKVTDDLSKKNVYLEHAAKILRHDMHSGINTYIPRGIKGLERRISKDHIKNLKIESSLKLIKEGLLHAQRVYKGVYEFTNLVKKDAEMETEYCKLDNILKDYLCKTAYSDQVAIGILPEVKVNEALFCTAVDNLVRNGLKYNDSEFKMVAITMEDESHIAIIDNG